VSAVKAVGDSSKAVAERLGEEKGNGIRLVADREKYLEFVAHCVALADKAPDAAERLKLLEMAQSWTRLADYAEEITKLVEQGREVNIIPPKSDMN
jgi:hypothetical protein